MAKVEMTFLEASIHMCTAIELGKYQTAREILEDCIQSDIERRVGVNMLGGEWHA